MKAERGERKEEDVAVELRLSWFSLSGFIPAAGLRFDSVRHAGYHQTRAIEMRRRLA